MPHIRKRTTFLHLLGVLLLYADFEKNAIQNILHKMDDLAQAVQDGHLVDFVSVESELNFITQGIIYDALSADEKEEYENTFTDEDGNVPESIEPSALNE